ncbi:MAG: ATP-binding cassette domain-containing protein, partial [Dehalococcoidia bacterium]|nr:ATP-binding cassette domain-containing protein [Dehalococcoidia bacterium]
MTSTPQASRTENNESVDSECALLSVSGVGFDYDNAAILEDVSLSAERGEFVALVGPSGCGKSTLLNLISGVLTAREGTIVSSGLVTRTERLGNISYMQQKDLLLPWRSVAGNSRMGLELRGIGRAESDIEVERLAVLFVLTYVIDSIQWQLSGGMRQ